MFAINNNDFKILGKCKDFCNYVDNTLENVPRKDKYFKDKLREIINDLLNYIFRCSYDDNVERLKFYRTIIKSDIAFLDFLLLRLYNYKYINEKNLYKITSSLIEINKMVTKWIDGKINDC